MSFLLNANICLDILFQSQLLLLYRRIARLFFVANKIIANNNST